MTTHNNPDSKQEAPDRIFVFKRPDGGNSWHTERLESSDIEYVRAPVAAVAGDAKLIEQVVEAVWRNVKRYEDGEIWMDTLRAKAQVKKVLNAAVSSSLPSHYSQRVNRSRSK